MRKLEEILGTKDGFPIIRAAVNSNGCTHSPALIKEYCILYRHWLYNVPLYSALNLLLWLVTLHNSTNYSYSTENAFIPPLQSFTEKKIDSPKFCIMLTAEFGHFLECWPNFSNRLFCELIFDISFHFNQTVFFFFSELLLDFRVHLRRAFYFDRAPTIWHHTVGQSLYFLYCISFHQRTVTSLHANELYSILVMMKRINDMKWDETVWRLKNKHFDYTMLLQS